MQTATNKAESERETAISMKSADILDPILVAMTQQRLRQWERIVLELQVS
jgi:hypothetical protein